MMNKNIFCTFPENNVLSFKHVFFEDIQPILFLCEDNESNLYICVMCDDRNGRTWIVSPTKKHYVTKMIFNEISMRNLFELSQHLGFSWMIKAIEGNWQYHMVLFDKIHEDDLPKKNAFFDADYEEVREYFVCVYDKNIKVLNDKLCARDVLDITFNMSIQKKKNGGYYIVINSNYIFDEVYEKREDAEKQLVRLIDIRNAIEEELQNF